MNTINSVGKAIIRVFMTARLIIIFRLCSAPLLSPEICRLEVRRTNRDFSNYELGRIRHSENRIELWKNFNIKSLKFWIINSIKFFGDSKFRLHLTNFSIIWFESWFHFKFWDWFDLIRFDSNRFEFWKWFVNLYLEFGFCKNCMAFKNVYYTQKW